MGKVSAKKILPGATKGGAKAPVGRSMHPHKNLGKFLHPKKSR